jgi:pyruvate formate lyase activating enzyme
MSVDAVLEAALRDVAFYGEQGGVTFGGGEPLLQWAGLSWIAQRLRSRGVHVAVDTSGFAPPAVIDAVPEVVDHVLVDLKLVTPEKHRAWTGRNNARILRSIRAWSVAMAGRLWVTTPVIPGVHDADELERIAAFIAALNPVPATRLIPYHRLGESKYAALGLTPPAFAGDIDDLMATGIGIYEDRGLEVLTW